MRCPRVLAMLICGRRLATRPLGLRERTRSPRFLTAATRRLDVPVGGREAAVLSRLVCQNFRSLEEVEIPLEPLTALVGPNGAGKSAVLRAIDLVAGPVWPSLQRLRFPHDFTGYEDTRELVVELGFSEPIWTEPDKLKNQHPIHSMRVRCRPYKRRTATAVAGDPNFDYEPLDALGEVPLECLAIAGGSSTNRPHRVTSQIRNHGGCVLIDHRRAITQHLPGTRGSVLGRLLAPALRELDKPISTDDPRTRRQMFSQRYEEATEVLRTPYVKGIERVIDETARRTLGFMGATASRDARVSFQITDPVNPYSSLRIVYSEEGLEFPAEEVGLGVQSAIVVGIFEALRGERTGAGTVLIDEPEMYLHPQAQRHFYGILVDLVDQGGTQVIYSTHSPVFAAATRFESLRLMRRAPGTHSVVAYVSDEQQAAGLTTAKSVTKLLTDYDVTRSEALFANAVLLVEGRGDLIAARGTAARLKLDLDARNLTILECGGKTSIPFHARLCQALGIPVCVMYDDDQWPAPRTDDPDFKVKREALDRALAENALIETAAPDANRRFTCHPTLEELMGIGRHADRKPMRIAQAVNAARSRDELPRQLVSAVECLDQLDRQQSERGPV